MLSSEELIDRELSGTRAGARYYAAIVDNLLAIVFALGCAQFLPIDDDMVRGLSAYVFYLLYYAASEGAFGATPAKWYFSLRVVDLDGRKCGFSRAALRTLGRVFDANPLFLGAMPAAILVWVTPKRQHLGDFFGKTLVVHKRDVRQSDD